MRNRLVGVMALGVLSAAIVFGGGRPSQAGDATAPVYLAQSSPPVEAQSAPAAKISFSGGEIAAGIGYTWGNGTIAFAGMQRLFHISGLSIVNVGVTAITATGEVYNLQRIEDFAGNYAAVSVGASLGGGGSYTYLRNQNGVVIMVTSTTAGLDFKLSTNEVNISLG